MGQIVQQNGTAGATEMGGLVQQSGVDSHHIEMGRMVLWNGSTTVWYGCQWLPVGCNI